MLSVGDDTLVHADGSALTHHDILPFLWKHYKANPTAAFIGFYLGYDFTQWLKSLSADQGWQLFHTLGVASRKRKGPNPEPWPVKVGDWEIDIFANRRFRISLHRHKPPRVYTDRDTAYDHCTCGEPLPYPTGELNYGDKPVTWKYFTNSSATRREAMFICDTGPFWQTAFMTAINPKTWPEPIVTDEEYSTLCEGKAARGETTVPYGDTSWIEETRRYNILENDVLSRMTMKIHEGFLDIRLNLHRKDWYGPGRAAELWLRQQDKAHNESINAVEVRNVVPAYALEMAQKTYYGGWFEQFIHGIIPTAYEYDINSAYPAIIADLPCLMHGDWRQYDGECPEYETDTLYMLHCTVTSSDPIMGGLPHRGKKGHITHPLVTTGWYWLHEIRAALSAGLVTSIETHNYVSYKPCPCPPPMAEIRSLYQKRQSVGKNTPQGKGLKLVYNSAYGKFAQSIGNPKFGNPIYASLITAGCRTLILEAIATHPSGTEAVTMIATDGIYFRTQHPTLTLDDNRLGYWTETELSGLTQFMPGVYWHDDARTAIANGAIVKLKSRGVNSGALAQAIPVADAAFTDWNGEWPVIDLNVKFGMTTCKQATTRNAWHTAGHVQKNFTRTIKAIPINKRNCDRIRMHPEGWFRTDPIHTPANPETIPYDKTFGNVDHDTLTDLFSGLCDPDGFIIDNITQFWETL
jgi:hypothetical protein